MTGRGPRGWLRPAALMCAVVVAGEAHAQGVRFGQNRIVVTANPSRLPADGQTPTRIRIEVRDQSNNPVPDGTEVVVSTNTGDLISDTGAKQTTMTVRTDGGYALVSLTSREPGTATVRVQYRDSRNQVLVEFIPLGERGRARSMVVHVEGGWVGYSSDLLLMEARGPAELRYRGLQIRADCLQVEPQALRVRAYGVKLKRNNVELEGEEVYLSLTSMKGVLRRFGAEGVEETQFNAFTLKPTQTEEPLPENAFRQDTREGRVWLVAKSIALFPGEKIVLRSATLHVDGHKILRYPPFWVIAFEGYQGSSNSNFVSFDSSGGLAIDFPFFFSVTDTSTGAVKIQRGATSGSVMARQGWSLALEQTYEQPGQDARGVLTIAGLPRSNWGIEFHDIRKILGGADSSLSIASPDHKNLFTDFSVFKYGKAGNLGVQAHFDRDSHTGNLSYGVGGDFYSTGSPIGRDVSFRWGSGIDAARAPTIDRNFVFEHKSAAFLDFRSWQASRSTSVLPALSDVVTWDTEGHVSNVAQAQVTLNQRIGQGVNVSLRYGLQQFSGRTRYVTLDTQEGPSHQVSLNVSAFASRHWDAMVNTNWDMTEGTLYAFGSLNYRPWRRWRFGLVSSYYRYPGMSFEDMEISVNRTIWGREVGVRYSTADGHFSLQMGAFSF